MRCYSAENSGDTMIKTRIKHSMDYTNNKSDDGRTALMLAVVKSDLSRIQELIDLGADVNTKDIEGNTALLLATRYKWKHDQVLRSLIRAGSDVNCQNNEGLSPLMMAAKYSDADSISLLVDSGADVNSVSNKDKTKTALSIFVNESYFDINKNGWLELLLDKGASSSYLSPEILHTVIIRRETKIIPKLIHRGLGPADVRADNLSLGYIGFYNKIAFVSPLCVALIDGNVALARYFVENLFLTASDVTFLKNYTDVRPFSQTHNRQKCLNFLDKMSSQPMSLFSLAFVSVTSSLAPGRGREDRVNLLPLPRKIKDKLLFQTEQVKAGVSEADEVAESESPIRVRHCHFGWRERLDAVTHTDLNS